jgi:hypothetical protein
MVKILGFRITPFFLFIIGLECLALLVSVYLGLMLYQDEPVTVTLELMDRSIYSGLFLVFLLSILTPGFIYQTKVISHIKKSLNEKVYGLVGAILTMTIILYTNASQVDSKTLFIASLLSAFVGLVISQTSLLNKYWRFMIRSGVN